MSEEVYHIPALLPEVINGLNIKPGGIYVDATFGGGGHSRAIVEQLDDEGHLYSFDQDDEAVARAFSDPRFTIVYSNFRYLKNFLRYYGVNQVDGVLADLGVSFHHFDDRDRGFSFRYDAPLDMRMNRKAHRSAAKVLEESTEEQLADIFYLYGELKQSRRIAKAIVNARAHRPIATTGELVDIVRPLLNPRQEKKELAMVFQALRIEVNNEIAALKDFLRQTLEVVRPGGRVAIITYHSLEDRLVKNFLRAGNVEGRVEKDFFGRAELPWRMVNNKPIVASDEEVERNPRSRSAKLRIAQRI